MESKSDRFESKIDSFRTMPAGTARDRARPLVEMMVRQQQAIRGQKMSAYDDVGGWLGVKRTWVRRLLGGQEVGMSGDRLLRIAAAYRKHCAAVEQSTTKERETTARRWEEFHAILAGLGEPDLGGPGLAAEPGRDRICAPARQDGRP